MVNRAAIGVSLKEWYACEIEEDDEAIGGARIL